MRQHVALDSYTSSPGWLGYLHQRARWRPELAERALSLVERALRETECWPSALVSSLCADPGQLSPSGREQAALLAERGLLTCYDLESLADAPGADPGEEPGAEDPQALRERRFDLEEFRAAARLVMNEPTGGHLFAVAAELIVYPHDDAGFGFVAAGPRAPRDSLRALLQGDEVFALRWRGQPDR